MTTAESHPPGLLDRVIRNLEEKTPQPVRHLSEPQVGQGVWLKEDAVSRGQARSQS